MIRASSNPSIATVTVPCPLLRSRGRHKYEKLTTLFRSLLFSGPKLAMEALTSYVSKHVLCLVLDPSSYQESLLPPPVESGSNCHEMPSIYPQSVTDSYAPPRTGQIRALVIEAEETSLSAHVASGPAVGNVTEAACG